MKTIDYIDINVNCWNFEPDYTNIFLDEYERVFFICPPCVYQNEKKEKEILQYLSVEFMTLE